MLSEVIKTERLVLRPVTGTDADSIVEQVGDYRVAGKLSRVPYPYHRSDAEDFIAWTAQLDWRSSVRAIAHANEASRLFGLISYEYNAEKDNGELGYWLAVPMWGQGYATEAVKAMARDAFCQARLPVLVACYFDDNPASGHVLRKAGFETVGACTAYSKARGGDVAVTNMRLSQLRWESFNRT